VKELVINFERIIKMIANEGIMQKGRGIAATVTSSTTFNYYRVELLMNNLMIVWMRRLKKIMMRAYNHFEYIFVAHVK
jgi:hypothetical protein